jgi:hypothetical protein
MKSIPLIFQVELIVDADVIRRHFDNGKIAPKLMRKNLKMREACGGMILFRRKGERPYMPMPGMTFMLQINKGTTTSKHTRSSLFEVVGVEDNLDAPNGKGRVIVKLQVPNTFGPIMPMDFSKKLWTIGEHDYREWATD